MRVLYWTTTFKPDISGVAVFSVPLIHGLQKRGRGIEFLVIAPHMQTPAPDDGEYDGIRVRRFSFYRPLNNRDVRQMAATVRAVADLKRAFQPDLIHINTVHAELFYHQQTSDAWDCPVLVSLHNKVYAWERNSLYGRLLQSAGWITAVSQNTLADLRRFMPEITPRSSAILNGMVTPALEPAPIDWRTPRLLCFGRLAEEKGFDLALRAFADIHRNVPTARLRIAGDGEARPELERLSNSLGLSEFVEFLGWVEPDCIPSLINDSALVLMPSRNEAFSIAAIQTGQMARPLIATAVGGLPEMIVDGETGFLVEPEQPAQIADRALYLLTHPELGDRIGKAARQRALSLFSMERAIDEYHQVYRMLTS
jgi:glycosyltransferase involved in cell wall biosynthesis